AREIALQDLPVDRHHGKDVQVLPRQEGHALAFGQGQLLRRNGQRRREEESLPSVVSTMVDEREGTFEPQAELFIHLAPRGLLRRLARLHVAAEDRPGAGPADARVIVPVLEEHSTVAVEDDACDLHLPRAYSHWIPSPSLTWSRYSRDFRISSSNRG